MRAAGQVMQHMFRPAEGLLGIDHPVVRKDRAKKNSKHLRIRQASESAVKDQFSFSESSLCGTKCQHAEQTKKARKGPATEAGLVSFLLPVLQHQRAASALGQMQKEAGMLTLYRRHVKACEHRHQGRKYRR